jgi:hypothetical protein
MVEAGRGAKTGPLLRRVILARVCARHCWKERQDINSKTLLVLHIATVDHFALALKITWSTGGHEALVAQLKRYEKSMHRHASRAIPSRLCRYRSSFTFSGRSHSPRYIPPADSCVTEAA